MLKTMGSDTMTLFLIKTDGQTGRVTQVSDALRAKFKIEMPFRIDSTDTVMNVDAIGLQICFWNRGWKIVHVTRQTCPCPSA